MLTVWILRGDSGFKKKCEEHVNHGSQTRVRGTSMISKVKGETETPRIFSFLRSFVPSFPSAAGFEGYQYLLTIDPFPSRSDACVPRFACAADRRLRVCVSVGSESAGFMANGNSALFPAAPRIPCRRFPVCALPACARRAGKHADRSTSGAQRKLHEAEIRTRQSTIYIRTSGRD